MTNSCGFDELSRCRKTVILLEDQLLDKNRDLTHQVGLNIFVLVIGLIVGFIFARLWTKK